MSPVSSTVRGLSQVPAPEIRSPAVRCGSCDPTLVDMEMSCKNGYEATRELRGLGISVSIGYYVYGHMICCFCVDTIAYKEHEPPSMDHGFSKKCPSAEPEMCTLSPVTSCHQNVSTDNHFGENQRAKIPCQSQKMQFRRFIGREFGLVAR